MTSHSISLPSAHDGNTTTVTIERTAFTCTAIIDGQAVVCMFKGCGFTCLVDNPAMLADAFRALCQK